MKVLAVVLSALTVAFAASNAVNGNNDTAFKEGKIVGGVKVDISLVPSQVAVIEIIESEGVRLLCSGNIINPKVVLTTAHCLANEHLSNLKVRSGSNFYEKEGHIVTIIRARVYPDFFTTKYPDYYAFDLALLYLSQSATPPGLPAARIVLWGTGKIFPPGTFGLISGWGATEENGENSEFLRRVALPIVSHQDCVTNYGVQVATYSICTGFSRGRRDGCHGDSGAGLVVGTKLAGVFTVGKGCGQENTPSAFASVSVFSDWIQRYIDGE